MRPLWLSLIIAASLAFLGFFPLMGLPGGLLYEKWRFVFGRVGLPKLFPELQGDRAWPAAILISIAWPWFLPLTFWIGARFGLRGWADAWPWLAGAYVVWTLAVCAILGRVVR